MPDITLSGIEGRSPINNILDYIKAFEDSNIVNLHVTDTDEIMTVTRSVLLFFPVFCGLEYLDDVYIPGVSRQELEILTALPLTDINRFGWLFISLVI